MLVYAKKLHEDAVLPKYAKEGDAGLDLVAINKVKHELYNEYHTGIAMEIPEGYVGLVFPRSSISEKQSLFANSVGVIDSSYRGEIKIRMREVESLGNCYNIGDKIAQIVIVPVPSIVVAEVNNLSKTDRGEGGFGSTN